MKRVLISSLLLITLLSLSFGVYAATQYTLLVNGKVLDADIKVIDGVSYIPVRAAGEALGVKVGFDAATNTISLTSETTATVPKIPVEQSNSVTINDVTITLNKVVQDSDSLRLHVTYTNNSDEEAMTGDSLAKFVANGTQYEYNSEFNFPRYYEQPVEKAPDFIEPGVAAESVIFFSPIEDVETINVVLNANFDDYRFNNVTVVKQ